MAHDSAHQIPIFNERVGFDEQMQIFSGPKTIIFCNDIFIQVKPWPCFVTKTKGYRHRFSLTEKISICQQNQEFSVHAVLTRATDRDLYLLSHTAQPFYLNLFLDSSLRADIQGLSSTRFCNWVQSSSKKTLRSSRSWQVCYCHVREIGRLFFLSLNCQALDKWEFGFEEVYGKCKILI